MPNKLGNYISKQPLSNIHGLEHNMKSDIINHEKYDSRALRLNKHDHSSFSTNNASFASTPGR
jgi:hypothetical protein